MKIRNSLLGIGLSLSLILSGMPVSAGQIESYTAYTAEDEDVICFEETADEEAIGNEAAPEGTVIIPDMAETDSQLSDTTQVTAEESDAELPIVYAEAGEPTGFAIESVEEFVSVQSDEAMAQDENTESKVAKVTVCDTQGNVTSETPYATWDEAVTAWTQTANSTLTLLDNVTLSNKIEIKTAGMTLDLNGHMLSSDYCIVEIAENGALTIIDSSETNTESNTVSGVIRYTESNEYCIFSKGTLTIKGGTITSAAEYNETVYVNKGKLTITGGTVEQNGNRYAVNIQSEVESAEISGGRISGNKYSAIRNNANLKITGGTVESTNGVNGIYNTGTLEITAGTIAGSQGGIYNSGTLTITGGIINGTAYGIKSSNDSSSNPHITISGNPAVQGAVTFLYRAGKIDLSGTEPEGWTVQQETSSDPLDPCYHLQAAYTDNNDNNHIMILPAKYALFDENGQTVTQLAKDQTVTIETKAKVAKVTVCDAQGNVTTEKSYSTWNEAVTAWTKTANSTLTLLDNVTLSDKITIDRTGMTLDLNGHSLSRNDRIVNVTKNGALTIIDSSETDTGANASSGVIRYTGNSGYCIFSNGTLTIKGGKITSAATSSETICVSKGNLAITGGTVEQTGEAYVVDIGSDTISAEISGGRISGNKSSAIDNAANLKITGGTVESTNGINNNGTLEITAGTIAGSQGGIVNKGKLTITGGTIQGTDYAIKSVKEGEALITISGNPTVQGAVTFLYRGGKIDLSSIEPAGWTVQHEFGGGQTDYPLQTAYTDNNDNIMILPVECYGLFDENNQKVTQLTKDQKATILIKHDWVYTADGASVHGGCRYKGCEAEQSFTLVQPEAFLYDGTAKTITLKQSGDAAEEIPKIVFCCEGGCIHAGTHTASITVGGVTASLTFAIGKAVPVYQKPAGLKAMEGDTLAQIVLPEGFAWVDPAQRVGEAGTKTFLANYTPADTTNYQSVTGIELSVEVAEAPKKNETESETTAPHVHTFGAWKTTSKATVFAPEVQTRTCSCGAAETQTVGRKLTAVLELPGKLKSLSIRKGDTKTFSLIMANGDSVKSVKSSAAKTVKATLDQKTGKLTLKALKADTAKLTIKLASGESRTYTVKVTNSTIKTTSVSVTSVKKNKLTLAKGKTHKLKTEVKPFTSTQKLTYKSSNKKVAAVTSAGKIKAVAPGKATITVKSGDKSVKIAVTVPGIALAKTSVSVKKGRTLTLSPKLYGISGKVTCTSSNKKIATVTSKGRIKGIKKGTARITVKAGGYTRTVTVKVK